MEIPPELELLELDELDELLELDEELDEFDELLELDELLEEDGPALPPQPTSATVINEVKTAG